MTIKFVCSCGKHLRARDEMAARRSACPACGAPVGVPSLTPNHRGVTAGPLSPAERRRTRPAAPPDFPPPPDATAGVAGAVTAPHSHLPADRPGAGPGPGLHRPPDTDAVRLAIPRERRLRRAWRIETRWYHCLLYPLRAWPLVLGLAVVLTGLTGVTVLALPDMVDLPLAQVFLMIPLLVLGYACGFLDCVLASATAGEVRHVHWPGGNVSLALKSCGTWLACFLAGPVVPAGAGFWYWLHCGDPEALDWLILAELVAVTVGYWLLALLAVSQKGRLRDANPASVADLAFRLGYRAPAATLLATGLVIGHGLPALAAVEEIQHGGGAGWLVLGGCWASGLFWATFLLRLLAVWGHAAPPPGYDSQGTPAEGAPTA
jgi:hypothetical protein